MTALDDFLRACEHEIARRLFHADITRDELTAGHAAFKAALDASEPIHTELGSIPVAEHVARISGGGTAALAKAAAPELSWIASTRLDEADADAGTEAGLAPLNDVRDLDRSAWGHVLCGLMLLRPNGTYPLHSHQPQELYLPISGDGQWRYGGSSDFRRLGPDSLVYNHPNDVHSVVAGDEPLLALYVLWADRDGAPDPAGMMAL